MLVDVAVAAVALGISVWVLVDQQVTRDLREPDFLAYLLLAVYSGSAAVRRGCRSPRSSPASWRGSRTPACSTPWR